MLHNTCIMFIIKNPKNTSDNTQLIQENVYVGPSYSNKKIKSFLDSKEILYESL